MSEKEKTFARSMSDVSIASSNHSSIRKGEFLYDFLPPNFGRFFQLDINGDDEPLSGRLYAWYIVTDLLAIDAYKWEFRQGKGKVLKKLSGKNEYDTLSYCWGDQSETFPLYMSHIKDASLDANGEIKLTAEAYRDGTVQIGRNLRDLLLELRAKKYRSFIWIDSICINQANELEKRQQISMMRYIYMFADKGYVWLGRGTPGEVDAMQSLPGLTAQLEEVLSSKAPVAPSDATSFTNVHLPHPSDSFWDSLGSIMRNPYWSRLWTLQEAVLIMTTEKGKTQHELPPLQIMLGSTTTHFDLIDRFDVVVTQMGLRSWIITVRPGVRPHSLYGFDGINEIRICRRARGDDLWGMRLSALLLGTRRRQATLASDVIFGMLGMMDRKTADLFKPGTTSSTAEVFIKFAKHYIRNEHEEHLFSHIATEDRRPDLPSWCPNFASSPMMVSLGSTWTGELYPSRMQKEQMFHAGFQLKGKWELPRTRFHVLRQAKNILTGRTESSKIYDTKNPRQITVLPDTDYLLVSALHLDVVTAVIPPNKASEALNFFSFENIVQTEEWDRACFQLTLQRLARDETVNGFDVYARTVTANRLTSQDNVFDSETVYDRHHNRDFITLYQNFKEFIQFSIAAEGDADPETNMDPETYRFAQALASVTCRRAFYATAGGRIGLGPAETSVGDAVAVVFYCPTPYIFRHSITSQTQLVGETYLHGFMYGEALDMFDRNEIVETKWIIE